MNTNTMDLLREYAGKGWHIFPLKPRTKEAFQDGGFKNATDDIAQIEEWYDSNPEYNWGLYPGKSGLCVIDIDVAKGAVRTALELPKTLSVKSAGGIHLYYLKPAGMVIGNRNKGLPECWDIRCDSGYIVIPPSIHPSGVEYVWEDTQVEIAPLPQNIIKILELHTLSNKIFKDTPLQMKPDYARIAACLAKLSQERCDDYNGWLEVGMVLQTQGDEFLSIWDVWSRKSKNYIPGICAEKWESFRQGGGKSIGSLYYWAEEDSIDTVIPQGGKHPKPSEYKEVWQRLGYKFSMNEMNDRIYLNGVLMSDAQVKYIMTILRENNYNSKDVFEDAMVSEAFQHQFHPIREYLDSLVWDGKDSIGKVAACFTDKDGTFPLLFRKWLVGAVNRILRPDECRENPMLVLDGKQGKGKSYFVAWLGSVLPEYHKVSPINPDNKDMIIDSVSYFIWEVDELGSTFRKADRDALKAFILRPTADYRSPYGRYPCKKKTICSYIGTINDEGGFLNDPTGNRRYRVCTLKKIDWNYTKIDINQVWAQAVELSKRGETCKFTEQEENAQNKVNDRYEVEEPLASHIEKYFELDTEDAMKCMPVSAIIEHLNKKDINLHVNALDKGTIMSITKVLTKYGLSKERRQSNGIQQMVWLGVSIRISEKEKEVMKQVDSIFHQ